MILIKEYVSLTTAAMKMSKRHFYSDHETGAKRKRCFTGQYHAKLSRACHPYLMNFLETFTRGRYHRDMKIRKILAFNSQEFRVYGTTNCKLMMIRGWGDGQTQKFHR